MALINETHTTLLESSQKFWEDELKNCRILLFELDKAIYKLSQDDIKNYSFDTGQNNINVSQQDLPTLIDRREKLIKQIADLEDKLGISGIPEKQKLFQVAPAW
jgi:hypothetical protein